MTTEVKFSEVPPGSALVDADTIVGVQSGLNALWTAAQFKAYIEAALPGIVDLQFAYDSGTGAITTVALKPVDIQNSIASSIFSAGDEGVVAISSDGIRTFRPTKINNADPIISELLIGSVLTTDDGTNHAFILSLNDGIVIGSEFEIIVPSTGDIKLQAASGVLLNGLDGSDIEYVDPTTRIIVRKININSWHAYNLSSSVGEDLQDAYDLGETIKQSAGKNTKISTSSTSVSLASILSGGSGYTVGDILTISGGAGTSTELRVSIVSAGVITQVLIHSRGAYVTPPISPNSPTGGTGTGASIDLTFVPASIFTVGDGSVSVTGSFGVNFPTVPSYASFAVGSSTPASLAMIPARFDSSGADHITTQFPISGTFGYHQNKGNFVFWSGNVEREIGRAGELINSGVTGESLIETGSPDDDAQVYLRSITGVGGTTVNYNAGNKSLDIITATTQISSFGEMHFSGNTTETVISAISTPVKVSGTYISGDLQNFTHVAGTLTYTEALSSQKHVTVSLTGTMNLASASITLLVAKNGVVIAKSAQTPFFGGASPAPQSVSAQCLTPLSQNDFIEMFVQNDTSLDNILISSANAIVSPSGGALSQGQVVTSWDGSTAPVNVTSSGLMSIAGGVVSTSAETNVVQNWNGSSSPISITSGTNISIISGVISTSAEQNVVQNWDGSPAPVSITAGTDISIVGGVVSFTGSTVGGIVQTWNGLSTPINVTAGTGISITSGVITNTGVGQSQDLQEVWDNQTNGNILLGAGLPKPFAVQLFNGDNVLNASQSGVLLNASSESPLILESNSGSSSKVKISRSLPGVSGIETEFFHVTKTADFTPVEYNTFLTRVTTLDKVPGAQKTRVQFISNRNGADETLIDFDGVNDTINFGSPILPPSFTDAEISSRTKIHTEILWNSTDARYQYRNTDNTNKQLATTDDVNTTDFGTTGVTISSTIGFDFPAVFISSQFFTRVGNIVTYTIKLTNLIKAPTATENIIYLNVPFSPNFTSSTEANGNGSCGFTNAGDLADASRIGLITSYPTNNTIRIDLAIETAAPTSIYSADIVFSYEIV